MVGDALEVQRPLELNRVARGMLDRLPHGELVGILGVGQVVANDVGIERPACVEVRLAEEDVSSRCILRHRSGGESQQRSRSEQHCPASSDVQHHVPLPFSPTLWAVQVHTEREL